MEQIYAQSVQNILNQPQQQHDDGRFGTILSELDITDGFRYTSAVKKSVTFSKVNFAQKTTFALQAHRTYYFFNCSFPEDIEFTDGDNTSVYVIDSFFRKLVVKDADNISITVASSKGSIVIYNCNYKRITIGDNINDNPNTLQVLEASFSSRQTGTLEIYKSSICDLRLLGTQGKEHITVINDLTVEHFIASNLFINGTFKIHALTAQEGGEYSHSILSANVSDDVKQKANELFTKSIFAVYKSDFGKAVFNGVFFSGFNLVTFSRSSVSDVSFVGCTWPKTIYTYSYWVQDNFLHELAGNKKVTKEQHFNRRENYRQIKVACSKQLDFISEQFFHGKEMNSYYKSISWKKEFWTRLILRLSYLTSNYGQSLLLPLLWLLGVNTIIVSAYLSFDHLLQCKLIAITDAYTFLAEVLRMANPLHKNACEVTGIDFIIDTVSRIISSYLIYNIIRATRRFVR